MASTRPKRGAQAQESQSQSPDSILANQTKLKAAARKAKTPVPNKVQDWQEEGD